MTFAEVFSGASQVWFFDAWGLFITFPLYLGHLLFFINLAMKTKRTSIPQLYLWGMLFGLYESWITKVLWWGYPTSEGAIFGLFLGIATFEFIVLVFFWHPIFSFVLPILVFEMLSLSVNSSLNIEEKVFSSHLNFLKKNKKTYLFLMFLSLFASFLTLGTGCDLLLSFFALLGSFGIILLLYFAGKKVDKERFSIFSFQFGKKGLTIVVAYIIGLNVITYFILLPERLPDWIIPYLIIILWYVLIAILLKYSRNNEETSNNLPATTKDMISLKNLLYLIIIQMIMILILCIFYEIGAVFVLFLNLSIFFIGPLFLIIIIYMSFKKRT